MLARGGVGNPAPYLLGTFYCSICSYQYVSRFPSSSALGVYPIVGSSFSWDKRQLLIGQVVRSMDAPSNAGLSTCCTTPSTKERKRVESKLLAKPIPSTTANSPNENDDIINIGEYNIDGAPIESVQTTTSMMTDVVAPSTERGGAFSRYTQTWKKAVGYGQNLRFFNI